MSPVASAVFTAFSETPAARFTRSSNGLVASSESCSTLSPRALCVCSMKGPIDHIHLLCAGKPHKMHRISGNANSQLRVLLGMVHRVDQHFAIQHIHIHVETRSTEKCVEYATQIRDPIYINSSKTFRYQRGRKRNSILGIAIRNLGYRSSRRVDAMAIAA